MEYLDHLDAKKQRELEVYCDAHRHKQRPTAVDVTRFTVELMEIVEPTPLKPQQKKELVTALYYDVAKQSDNGFDKDMDISDMIELAWDIRQKKFKFGLKKKGCLTWLCCKSCSVGVSPKGVSFGMQPAENHVDPVVGATIDQVLDDAAKSPKVGPTIIVNGGDGDDNITVNTGSVGVIATQ